jgi:hypothetical protein
MAVGRSGIADSISENRPKSYEKSALVHFGQGEGEQLRY